MVAHTDALYRMQEQLWERKAAERVVLSGDPVCPVCQSPTFDRAEAMAAREARGLWTEAQQIGYRCGIHRAESPEDPQVAAELAEFGNHEDIDALVLVERAPPENAPIFALLRYILRMWWRGWSSLSEGTPKRTQGSTALTENFRLGVKKLLAAPREV